MKIGFSLPNIGPIATAESVTKIAQRAEALGYSSLWTIERLLYPVKLQAPYPATPDGSLPKEYRRVLDPLDTLTFVAAQTKTIRLGTSVLDMPYHNPVVLVRRLTTIDVLSNGRLSVGLGLGWNKDEMDATGADMKKRGALADEFLPLLKAIWTTNPVEFHGQFFNVPKSYIDLKPIQKPHPPLWVACSRQETIVMAARMGIGALTFGFLSASDAQKWTRDYYATLESCNPIGYAVNPNVGFLSGFMCHQDGKEARKLSSAQIDALTAQLAAASQRNGRSF